MSQIIDAELVALARCGDKTAFSHLIKRHQTLAFRFAQKMVGRVDIAQELVQEAFLQAYLSLDRLRDDDRFQSWLCGIVLTPQRIEPMIQVTVADIIFSPSIELESGSIDLESCVVILWDRADCRFLPIFVGITSGEAIAQILTETTPLKPMTFQFISNMLINLSLTFLYIEPAWRCIIAGWFR